MDKENSGHVPVLLKEVFEILKPVPGEFFIDGTLGLAGHAKVALKKINPEGIFLGIDRDISSIEKAKNIISEHKKEEGIKDVKVIIVSNNFTEIPDIIIRNNINRKADCLLLDLGFSSIQVFSGKGFSYDKDEPLIMRYDGDASKLTAARVVNEYDYKKLSNLLKEYGEERFSERIADGIVKKRKNKPIRTTKELSEIIKNSLPSSYLFKARPEARTFFALRNYINEETESLKKILNLIPDIMADKGRAAIITFNSLEDKIVKEIFKELSKKTARLLTKKPISPTKEEIVKNNKSRSAKLRAIQIINK
jgi:16S rRNA (cytosine1402-N4)-methyltransferase